MERGDRGIEGESPCGIGVMGRKGGSRVAPAHLTGCLAGCPQEYQAASCLPSHLRTLILGGPRDPSASLLGLPMKPQSRDPDILAGHCTHLGRGGTQSHPGSGF